jgi:hypothetical protein
MDECLFEAEPHRKYIATLTVVAGVPLELQDGMNSLDTTRGKKSVAV